MSSANQALPMVIVVDTAFLKKVLKKKKKLSSNFSTFYKRCVAAIKEYQVKQIKVCCCY